MKKIRTLTLLICLVLLLTGCNLVDGTYHSVSPHRQDSESGETFVEAVEDDLQLRTALADMVNIGMSSHVITVAGFEEQQLLESMDKAVAYIKTVHPIGAYAVDDIVYEVGNVGGTTGVAVEITYRHGRSAIQKIKRVTDMEEARACIGRALAQVEPGLVLLVENYHPEDILQLVEDYAAANPSMVMEIPEVAEASYPDSGDSRVWELKFTYQNSRDSLRDMQALVGRVFDSAALYVTENASDARKLSQLYGFLMERFYNYQVKASITPAYSLLNHGVGDSGAFATVYAEMCARIGVDCQVVLGALEGEPYYWNIVRQDGYYYHLDLLECRRMGHYYVKTDIQMDDYVWDYSAFPRCQGRPNQNTEIPVGPGDAEEPTDPPESTGPEVDAPTDPTETEPSTQPTDPPVTETPTEPDNTETEPPAEPETQPPTAEPETQPPTAEPESNPDEPTAEPEDVPPTQGDHA